MNLHKYLVLPSLLLVSSLMLFACVYSGKESLRENTLYLPISVEPSSLDPRRACDSASSLIVRHLYDGITRIDYKGNPQLSLAKHVSISPDRLTYTFFLREAYWSNGDRITSEDFVRTWLQVLDPKFPAENAYHLYVIKGASQYKQGKLSASQVGIKALDKWTLEIQLRHPLPYFFELLAFDAFYPVHKNMDFTSKHQPITSGPFTLQNHLSGNEIILTKNRYYWDAINVHIEELNFQLIPDETTALSLYEQSQLDWVGSPLTEMSSEAIQLYTRQEKINVIKNTTAYWVVLNTQKPPFNNKKFRQALCYSINREAITYALQGNQAASRFLLPPYLKKESTNYFEDDPTKAYTLLGEALNEMGLDRSNLPTFTYTFNPSCLHKRVALLLQQYWRKELGLEVELETQEWPRYMQSLKNGDFSMGRYGWRTQFSDPLNYLEIFNSRNAQLGLGYNFSNWSHEEYDNLIESIRQLSPGKEREQAISEAEAILLRELPIIPIFFNSFAYLQNPKLHNVVLTNHGRVDFKWSFLERRH